ncbi:helix-turn-helix domain-containing protein [Nanoarchaeota archaeon]
MWVAKIKISGEKGSIGSRTKKFNVQVIGYPISSYTKKDGLYIHAAGFIQGEEKDKKAFIKDWKKDKKAIHLEQNGDFFIMQIKEPLNLKPMYSHRLIHVKNIIIDKEGYNLWHIASWDRKELTNFIKLVKKEFQGKLLSIKKEKIKDLSILSIQPDLTKKQKTALNLAVKHGYYNYPRDINLEELANMMKISYSTFQAHLRKAEQKIIPFSTNRSQ